MKTPTMDLTKLSPEELTVYRLIENYYRITQQEIATSESWLGSHPEEAHLNISHRQTTLRKVRQIVRDLRLNHGAQILSDKKGYYLPKTEEDIKEYIERLEATAKAQQRAWNETYRSMAKNCSHRSEFFETQLNLFEKSENAKENDLLMTFKYED